ncbi:2-dehydropantoate 2-reductase [Pontivivens insulae]|uniref:2-dehydropantoate 2-reductase n=1 Tax=Pontivivens insulae TaxID=1639689 RepID=A0A2R8AD58_9RHOB|nr:2-dehydropantoate 2-reductase [Pontivivens insulae]RED14102.1 ketopantoate reductase [Pontivivens insulae]SPF30176.1 2-dehydropantoate 2-reductase [Pontivivens insulae]
MIHSPEHIVILGAGAVGCFVGATWAIAAPDWRFTLIARPHLAQDLAGGMRLTDYDGLDRKYAPQIETTPEALRSATLIVLTVKGPATQAAIAQIEAHAPADVPVLTLQNGLEPARLLKQSMPDREVLTGTVTFNVSRQGKNQWHKGSRGGVFANEHPILRQLAEAAEGGPAELELVKDMVPVQWGKLLLNLNNAVNALSGLTLREQLSQRTYRRVLAASIGEALDIMEYAAILPMRVGATTPQAAVRLLRLPDFLFTNIALRIQKMDAHARSSMADDFAAGRLTEIDDLNGEIVRLAHEKGVKAPVNAAILKLVKLAENGGRRQYSGPELVDAVKARG